MPYAKNLNISILMKKKKIHINDDIDMHSVIPLASSMASSSSAKIETVATDDELTEQEEGEEEGNVCFIQRTKIESKSILVP